MPRESKTSASKRCTGSKPKADVFTSATGSAVHAWGYLHLASTPPQLAALWDSTRVNVYLALRELLRKEMSVTSRHPRMEVLSCLRLRIESLPTAPLPHLHLMLFVPARTLAYPSLVKANPKLRDQQLRDTAKQLSYTTHQIKKAAGKP